jgi:hypothetical protein
MVTSNESETVEVQEKVEDKVMPYRNQYHRMPENEENEDETNDQTATSPKDQDTSFISVEKGESKTSKQESSEDPSNEDEGWKDRYNNLRSFSDRKITTLTEEINNLKDQGVIHKDTPLPATEEEVSEWMEKYSDTAKVIESIVIKRSGESNKAFEERLAKVESRERKANKKEAELEIKGKHRDYEDLQNSDHFKDWILTQPDAIVGCLINSADFDAYGAIRAIDLYKADLRIEQTSNQELEESNTGQQSAADHVPTKQRVEVRTPKNKPVFTTSQIAALKPHEYNKLEKEIDLASREGRVVDDG